MRDPWDYSADEMRAARAALHLHTDELQHESRAAFGRQLLSADIAELGVEHPIVRAAHLQAWDEAMRQTTTSLPLAQFLVVRGLLEPSTEIGEALSSASDDVDAPYQSLGTALGGELGILRTARNYLLIEWHGGGDEPNGPPCPDSLVFGETGLEAICAPAGWSVAPISWLVPTSAAAATHIRIFSGPEYEDIDF